MKNKFLVKIENKINTIIIIIIIIIIMIVAD